MIHLRLSKELMTCKYVKKMALVVKIKITFVIYIQAFKNQENVCVSLGANFHNHILTWFNTNM